MGEKNISNQIRKDWIDDTIQKILDIMDENDGKEFVDIKQEIIQYIESQENTLLEEKVAKSAVIDNVGKNIKDRFGKSGNIKKDNTHVCVRDVQERDRDKFFELQKETSMFKSMLIEEPYRMMLWNEHIQDRSIMFTIEVDGEYAGFCGINNISSPNWELAIELLKKFHNKGIGYTAMNIMLTEIKSRLGVDEFRIKIDPENYSSQRLFEKLGATPYGIAEYILHKKEDIIRCEEENLDGINDGLVRIAEKFGVEPRKLLSHVLEYELKW